MTTQQIDLPVLGMTCSACVRNVERALNKTEGVDEAAVNFATERASVNYDPAVYLTWIPSSVACKNQVMMLPQPRSNSQSPG